MGLSSAGLLGSKERLPAEDATFRLRDILSSAIYGEMPPAEILPTIPEITAAIDKSRAYEVPVPRQFRGYGLPEDGVPIFLYREGEEQITCRFHPNEEGGLTRTLTRTLEGRSTVHVEEISW